MRVRFALHAVEEPTGKSPPPVCPGELDSADPITKNIACDSFTTARPGNSYNWVYLVVGGGTAGIDGVSFGVEYSRIYEPGYLSGWTLCSDGEAFPSTNPAWPASGSGMTLTWSTCQETEMYDHGIHAVVARFYMYAYTKGKFKITPNRTTAGGPELAVNTCGQGTTNLLDLYSESLWIYLAGWVDFGSGPGFNPCWMDEWLETKPSTWGRIKTRFARGRE